MDFLSDGFQGFERAIEAADIHITFCERFDEKSDIWNFESHNHPYTELIYFLSGSAKITASGASINTSYYDFVIYPRGAYHMEHLKYGQPQEVICVWADIPGLDLKRAVHMQDKDASVKWMLEKLNREFHCDRRCEALITHYIKAIALYIARSAFAMDLTPDPLSRVILYMREHMVDPIKLSDLAGLIYVSESYLCRTFKRRMGVSIIDYLRAIRVETAQTILASTNKTIEEVSEIVGYNSPKYFYKAFRHCVGVSPREFKMSCKHSQS